MKYECDLCGSMLSSQKRLDTHKTTITCFVRSHKSRLAEQWPNHVLVSRYAAQDLISVLGELRLPHTTWPVVYVSEVCASPKSIHVEQKMFLAVERWAHGLLTVCERASRYATSYYADGEDQRAGENFNRTLFRTVRAVFQHADDPEFRELVMIRTTLFNDVFFGKDTDANFFQNLITTLSELVQHCEHLTQIDPSDTVST